MGLNKVKIFLRILFFYLALGLLSWMIFFLLMRSDFLRIQEITVTGNHRLATSLVIETSGVLPGENIFGIRAWEVERRLERILEVRDARVKKVFPRALLIEIEEREPFAVVVIGDVTYCVDRDAFEVSNIREETASLPRIWMDYYDSGALADALEMIDLWKETFETPLTEIRVEDRKLFILNLYNGIFIRSEGPRNLQDKAALLAPLLREVQIKALQVGGFDLRMRRDIVLIRNEGESF
ncbi:MAG TPA: FtsQ-type POTRA domain-containing protein [Atribacteraceae bacterium]|nr:FtsQ-type POTRA domain-containing protein [Atribacteraceae bacterium]